MVWESLPSGFSGADLDFRPCQRGGLGLRAGGGDVEQLTHPGEVGGAIALAKSS